MNKFQLTLFAAVLAFSINAQNDSLKKFRISGFQADLSLIGTAYNLSSQQEFKNYIHDNELLNRDLSGYKGATYGVSSIRFPGHFSGKMMIALPTARKRLRAEAFIGLRYGNGAETSANYSKQTYDTTGTYIDPVSKRQLTTVNNNDQSYNYVIQSRQIAVLIGLNLTTNKSRRLWLSTGLELAPGISFANVFRANYTFYRTELVLNENSRLDKYDSYSRGNPKALISQFSSRRLGGIGFSAQVTLPQAMYLRLSKRLSFWKHVNAMAYLAPGIYISTSKYTGNSIGFALNSGLGLRYNL